MPIPYHGARHKIAIVNRTAGPVDGWSRLSLRPCVISRCRSRILWVRRRRFMLAPATRYASVRRTPFHGASASRPNETTANLK